MTYLPLTQDPLSIKSKNLSDLGSRLLSLFVESLNECLVKNGCERLWYQPDNTPKWPYRYFWLYLHNSAERDFIVRINFVSRDAFQVQFSHFGARVPAEVEFMSKELASRIQYLKGWPPLVKISNEEDCPLLVPMICDHLVRVSNHLRSGGKLPLRGTSHIEIAVGNFLKQHDSRHWTRWYRPDFLGQKDVDLALPNERIAIEIQGDYWHRFPGAIERDMVKRKLLMEHGWSLIWAWESCVKEQFGTIVTALQQVRNGERFKELKKGS